MTGPPQPCELLSSLGSFEKEEGQWIRWRIRESGAKQVAHLFYFQIKSLTKQVMRYAYGSVAQCCHNWIHALVTSPHTPGTLKIFDKAIECK